jgi:hypothetical protein
MRGKREGTKRRWRIKKERINENYIINKKERKKHGSMKEKQKKA